MKYEIKNSNNLVAISGRIGKITPKFNSLTNVSVANRLNQDETEWLYLNFSNPNNAFNGVEWADYANEKLKAGDFILAVCYKKQNGDYTNYYVNMCNNQNLFDKIPNTSQYAFVGKIIKIENPKDNITNVTLSISQKEYTLTFMDNDKIHMQKFASYLSIGQVIGCIATRVDKNNYTTYYANAAEYGPKPKE